MKHKLIIVSTALMLASCSAGETAPTTSAEVAEKQISHEDRYSLKDISDAQTTFAKDETEIFTGTYGYYGDLILLDFSCEAISRVTPWNVSVCALGGTSESPFALVIGDESVDRQSETAKTTLLFSLFVPTKIDNSQEVRAVRVASGLQERTLGTFDSQSIDVLRVDAGPAGKALAIQSVIAGGSRAWNEIEMISLNHFGSVQVVAKFKGEGVAEFDDGRGFIFTNYHYADNEAMCCPSYWVINYFRPGANGWTHSMRTVPSNPDKEIYEEEPFKSFKKTETVATYNYTSVASHDE
jgi:hypothetical protein